MILTTRSDGALIVPIQWDLVVSTPVFMATLHRLPTFNASVSLATMMKLVWSCVVDMEIAVIILASVNKATRETIAENLIVQVVFFTLINYSNKRSD